MLIFKISHEQHVVFIIYISENKRVRRYLMLQLSVIHLQVQIYRKTSSISRTKFQNSTVSCILLQLPSLNPLKPGVKLRMKM